MHFLSKHIAKLCKEIKKDPFQLDILDDLYTAYINEENRSGMQVVREGRYLTLSKMYPYLPEIISFNDYTARDYFESPKRNKLESQLSLIKIGAILNPTLSIKNVTESLEKFFKMKEYALTNIRYVSQQLKQFFDDPDFFEVMSVHTRSIISALGEMQIQNDKLGMEYLEGLLENDIILLAKFLDKAKEVLDIKKLIGQFNPKKNPEIAAILLREEISTLLIESQNK